MIIVGALGILMVRLHSDYCRALQALWNERIRYSFNKFAAIDIDVCSKCQLISMKRTSHLPVAEFEAVGYSVAEAFVVVSNNSLLF